MCGVRSRRSPRRSATRRSSWTPCVSSSSPNPRRRFTRAHDSRSEAAAVNESCLDAAIASAREAGAVLAERFAKGVRTEAKGRFDLVTEADRAAEAIILRRIRSAFPSPAVVAEESGIHDGGDAGFRWHIDPLDGTKNFVRGYPAFTVSIALECGGELATGVVYDPIRGEMFVAERGAGAFCNDQRCRRS